MKTASSASGVAAKAGDAFVPESGTSYDPVPAVRLPAAGGNH